MYRVTSPRDPHLSYTHDVHQRSVGKGPCLSQGMQKHTGESISVLSVVSRMTQTSFPCISTVCKNNEINKREIKRSFPCQQIIPQTSVVPDQWDAMEGKERLIIRVYMLKDNTATRDNTKLSGAAPKCWTRYQSPKGLSYCPDPFTAH